MQMVILNLARISGSSPLSPNDDSDVDIENLSTKGDGDKEEAEEPPREEDEEPSYSLDAFLAGGCQFECFPCKATFSSSTDFWAHTESAHGLDQAAYKERHGSDFATKTVKIECAVCFKVNKTFCRKTQSIFTFLLSDYPSRARRLGTARLPRPRRRPHHFLQPSLQQGRG